MKTHIPLTDDPAQKEFLLQRYRERVERLSQQNRVIEICTDAGFLNTVEVGQYFMTKDTEEFSQFSDSVACREYTLPRDEDLSELKGWIRGNTKIGPVLEVTTCCLQGKYGVEIRTKSVSKDNSHSWVRITHDLNKLVTNLNNRDQDDNEQETSETQFEEYVLKLNAGDFASRSKAKAKPQRRTSACSSTRTVPIWERTWTDIEPQDYSPIGYPVSKKLIYLLRDGSLLREKHKWTIEKLKLDNARRLRGIYFIDPEKEFKETIKNARKKLETSVAPAMPCKIMKKNCGSGGSNKVKTKLACILEADESTRLRMGNSVPNHHEDHIAGKGNNSPQHHNLVLKFIPMPQAMKIPAAKAAVDKEWEKLEKISAWNLTKVRSKKEVIDEARTSGATVHFASLMDICHLKNSELEPTFQKYKGRWYSDVTL